MKNKLILLAILASIYIVSGAGGLQAFASTETVVDNDLYGELLKK